MGIIGQFVVKDMKEENAGGYGGNYGFVLNYLFEFLNSEGD
ncbi:MAG: hypothetical protein ACN6OB_21320 [Chryseobacterium jejuense]